MFNPFRSKPFGALAMFVLATVTATSAAVAVSRVQFATFDQALRAAVTRADYPTAASDVSEGWMNLGGYDNLNSANRWRRVSVATDGRLRTAAAPASHCVSSAKALDSMTLDGVPIAGTQVAGAATQIRHQHVFNSDATDYAWCCSPLGCNAVQTGIKVLAGGSADFDTSDDVICEAGSGTLTLHVTICYDN